MRVPLSRIALVPLCAVAMSFAACEKPLAGATPPTPPPAASSFTVYSADLASNDVREVDPVTGVTQAVIPVGKAPSALAFDGGAFQAATHLFVANTGSGTVSVINPATNSVDATISVCAGPRALLYHHDSDGSRYIYVACGDGTVSILDANSLKVHETITVGGSPIALAQAEGNIIYTFTVLRSDGTLAFVQYDSGAFKVAYTLPVQANPLVVSEFLGDYYVASSDGTVERFSNNNSNAEDVRFKYVSKNTSAHAFQSGSQLFDQQSACSIMVFSDDAGNDVQLFNEDSPLNDPLGMYGVGQTLTTGAAPKGAAVAVIMKGASAGSYWFVANSNGDSISEFTSQSIFLDAMPVFGPGRTLSLAAGTHPVALAVYYKKSVPTPSPTGTPSPTPAPTATPSPTPAPTSTPTPSASSVHLYVANFGGGNVAQYASPFGSASVPALTFSDTTPVGGPVGIAVNTSYVATSHVTGEVDLYQQPVSASSAAVATFGGSAFGLMTFDAQGDLWATSQNSSVVEYLPPFTNSTSEAIDITDGFTSSYGIAFDASRNLYVTNSDSSATIVVYASPYTSRTNTYTVPMPGAKLHGMAVSGSNLYVADTYNNLIYVYALPLTTNAVPMDQFTAVAPVGLAFDANGTLYVTSQGTNQIQMFNPPFNSGSRPVTTITSGVNEAFGIAAGP
ncbi:MAG TPA: hypothetical protein VFH72_14895 [Candidatus Baltobacteraceae bacterium]|nr:hypothetical protein [Candidatus Baltobacteraceae bacterium]